MARNERLTEWVDAISLNLMALEFRDLEVDFTEGSLRALETELLDEFFRTDDVDDSGERAFLNGAAGYLGEALLRLTGGGWGWGDEEPFIRPDKALGLALLFPARLVERAVTERSGRIFTDAYAAWADAAARHRAANPGWTPKKQHTSGVDPFEMDDADAVHIAGWTAERKVVFPAWVATYGPETDWSFGPESLDDLEALLARHVPSAAELYLPPDPAFLDGAVWYFGEVVRRIRGGRWEYRTPVRGVPNPYAGRPYIVRSGADREPVVPLMVFSGFVTTKQHGALRAEYVQLGGG
ncbi:hypothetical protein IU459_35835 [Nocardia amamiensis]|uniref:Uncharacterized protein n=1 Tax=Nocardia amamiensis TaxID=404578 RepID=A0ABS0D240_9NOCA|nr:hypothetical protein [Nocardia amamiensis]MBF6302856.1 hypothetical protein [Nocardia amamiensis]